MPCGDDGDRRIGPAVIASVEHPSPRSALTREPRPARHAPARDAEHREGADALVPVTSGSGQRICAHLGEIALGALTPADVQGLQSTPLTVDGRDRGPARRQRSCCSSVTRSASSGANHGASDLVLRAFGRSPRRTGTGGRHRRRAPGGARSCAYTPLGYCEGGARLPSRPPGPGEPPQSTYPADQHVGAGRSTARWRPRFGTSWR